MKNLLRKALWAAAVLGLLQPWFAAHAAKPDCEAKATEARLGGAARTAFVRKCERDAGAAAQEDTPQAFVSPTGPLVAQSLALGIAVLAPTELIEAAQPVPVSSRTIGNSFCSLERVGAFKGVGYVVIEYKNSKCTQVNHKTELITEKGRLRFNGIANATPFKSYSWSDLFSYRLPRGYRVFLRFDDPLNVSTEQIETAALYADLCVSDHCLRDADAAAAIVDKANLALADTARARLETASANSRATPHPLSSRPPAQSSPRIHVDSGSLEALDWFAGGLQAVRSRQPTLSVDFLRYLRSRRLLSYKTDFANPFDRDDFQRKVDAEIAGFVTAVLDHPTRALPDSLVTFTPVMLRSYDFDTGWLTFSPCRDLGQYNSGGQNGMRCGGIGAGLLPPGGDLERSLHTLASGGELIRTGRAQFVKFATFFNGDNTGAPVFAVSYGIPGELKVKLPRELARSLFDLARTTKFGAAYADYRGKMIYAKVLYGRPEVKGFSTSIAQSKGLLYTFNGGAVVEYEVRPKAVCFYDESQASAQFCIDL